MGAGREDVIVGSWTYQPHIDRVMNRCQTDGQRSEQLCTLYISQFDTSREVRNEAPRSSVISTEDGWMKEMAANCLADLTLKAGDQTFPTLLPLIATDIAVDSSPIAQVCVGACISLSSLLSSATRPLITTHLAPIVACIRTGLCDPESVVRRAAAITFDGLCRTLGSMAVQKIVAGLLGVMSGEKGKEVVGRVVGMVRKGGKEKEGGKVERLKGKGLSERGGEMEE